MASELQATIERLLSKTSVLIEKYHVLESEKVALVSEVEDLRETIFSMQKKLQSLSQENEYLRMARTISASAEQLAENKAVIDQLVRDVDKCISQLT